MIALMKQYSEQTYKNVTIRIHREGDEKQLLPFRVNVKCLKRDMATLGCITRAVSMKMKVYIITSKRVKQR